MKRQYWMILILAVILLLTLGMLLFFQREEEGQTSITRALAAKMAVLAREGSEGQAASEAVDEGQPWYTYYMEKAADSCGMKAESEEPGPMDLLTYGEALGIAGAFGVDGSALSFEFKESRADRPITFEDWFELYDQMIGNSGHISVMELFVLGTPSNIEGLSPWQCLTDQGSFSARGLSMDAFMDSRVTAYVCGSELVCVKELQNGEQSLDNLWVTHGQEKTMTVFLSGYYRTFELEATLSENIEKVMASVTFKNRQIASVTLKTAVIKGEILAVGEESIDIKGYGKVPTTENFRVYSLDQGMAELTRDALEVGNKYTEFIVEGNAICGALIRAGAQERTIRAVLSCDGYTGYEHSTVSLTSHVPFWTICGDTRTDYAAGTTLNIDDTVLTEGQTMTVQTSATAGTVELLSLNRSSGHPKYRGTIEITHTGQGFRIVNELLLEEYLYGVVPSEMPPFYEAEALKTQAICARSFAVDALDHPRFPEWNVHVDDSTATQVYLNAAEDERANAAVDATAGQVLWWEDTPVKAYFYSTSCGSSSSPGEVWLSGESPAYMQGRLQIVGESERELSSEDAFRAFIDDYGSRDYFEKDISWFRWKTTVSLADLRTSVDKSLLTRIRTVPSLITVRAANGNFVEKEISTVGDILKVSVGERSASGVLTSVIVEGSEETIKISGEYNIRLLLAPLNSPVVCDDGTDAGTMTMLPSGYFYINDNGDGTYTLRGGGYGHGVGMSQNGVQALAGRGLSCEEILAHYFTGTTVAPIDD